MFPSPNRPALFAWMLLQLAAAGPVLAQDSSGGAESGEGGEGSSEGSEEPGEAPERSDSRPGVVPTAATVPEAREAHVALEPELNREVAAPSAGAVLLVTEALHALSSLQESMKSEDTQPTEWLDELSSVRRALEVSLVELGRTEERQRLRSWLQAEGLVLTAAPAQDAAEVADSEVGDRTDLVTPSQFDTLVQAIGRVSFTEGKMQVLVRDLEGRAVTSQQAGILVELFSFSRDRVDALVFLHSRITDSENFAGLLSALKFESDRETVRSQLGLDG